MATYSPGWTLDVDVLKRVRLDLVGVEDLLEPRQTDQWLIVPRARGEGGR